MHKQTHVQLRSLAATMTIVLLTAGCSQKQNDQNQVDYIAIDESTELSITRSLQGGAAGSSWTYAALKRQDDLASIPIAEFDTLHRIELRSLQGATVHLCYDGTPLYLSKGVDFMRAGAAYQFLWEAC
ncbi:hypothetical protein IWC96_06500 [Brevundimonas sp. BAL450]|nr:MULTISPECIES: hypothetical protein [Brevundimonas]MBG7614931.1 hypothetical protein [Brevundimonas sp. BAL450]